MKPHVGEEGYVVKVRGTSYLPQEILALVLSKLKRDAQGFLGGQVEEAVLTAPPWFSRQQRRVMRETGELCGLRVASVISEAEAAVLAAGLGRKEGELVCVLSMGGRSSWVAALRVRAGDLRQLGLRVRPGVGGREFDVRIAEHLARRFSEDTGCNVREGAEGRVRADIMDRLLEAAEAAKIDLSGAPQTRVSIPHLIADRALSLDVALSEVDVGGLVADLLAQIETAAQEALAEAGVSSNDVDAVVLAGGAAKLPLIRRFAAHLLGKEPTAGPDPQLAAVLGAALAASRRRRNVQFVAAHAIGVETDEGRFVPLVAKDASLPAEGALEFTTAQDGQDAINFPIFEGDAEVAAQNFLLGEMRIDALEPAPAGVPRIRVRLRLNPEGTLKCVAENVVTGRRMSLDIESAGLRERGRGTPPPRPAAGGEG
jgi:molecular chaperone DnaK